MNLNAEMSRALHRNLLVKTVDAFQISGSVIVRTIVEMDRMKETFVLKKLVLISNSLVLELVIVFLNLGFAMVMMIVSVSSSYFF